MWVVLLIEFLRPQEEPIAALSVSHPNLVAWSVDDFVHNPQTLNAERLRRILSDARAINPKLAFIPCCY